MMNDASPNVAGEVLLPDDQHKLYCWKVRNGSAVQRGETVALAILKQKDSESTTPVTAATAITTEVKKPAASAHRRPTKRRRPGALAAVAAAATATTASGTNRSAAGGNNNSTEKALSQPTIINKTAPASTTDKMKKLLQMATSDRVPILATADGLVRMGNGSGGPLMIGYIEECLHPTVVERLCAVCGKSVSKDSNGSSSSSSSSSRVAGVGDDEGDINKGNGFSSSRHHGNSNNKMSRVTVSGGITVSVSASEGQRMALQDAERLRRQRKLSLVLDLDHTLLHATNDVRARQELARDDVRTLILPIMEEGKHILVPNQLHHQQHQHHPQQQLWMQHFVKLRPGVKEFLQHAMSMYEIGVYTAGTRQYAEQITIILARHVVGAKHDQTDLDHLRNQVARAQRELDDSSRLIVLAKDKDNDSKPAAAKTVTAPAPSSSPNASDPKDSTKTDETLAESKNSAPVAEPSSVIAATKADEAVAEPSSKIAAAKKKVSEAADDNEAATNGNKAATTDAATSDGDSSTLPMQDGNLKSCSDEEGSSSKMGAEKGNKAADGDSKNGIVVAPLLDEESNEKSSTIADENSNEKLVESEKTSIGEVGLKSAMKEEDRAEKKKANSKKRKRVTFGETPPTVKSDQPTLEELEKLRAEFENLRAELHEAERMEALAHDLKQRLFGSRVVSRTDVGDLGTDVKSLKRIFPCGGTMAVVVDDREDVWANARDTDMVPKGEPPHNLLVVRPYHWNHFLGYADVNNASGEDLVAELDDDGRNKSKQYDNDQDEKQLLWTSDVLRRIHQRYYGEESASAQRPTTTLVKPRLTVPELMRNMRREVLMGAKIVLSGLVPLHRQREGGRNNRARPAFVRYAENLGAIVLPRVGPGLTHVVAAKDGTDKILNARKIPGCWIVKPSWLMESVWSLTRCDPLPHALGPPPAIQPKSDDSDDDDEEDLAAEFENELMGE